MPESLTRRPIARLLAIVLGLVALVPLVSAPPASATSNSWNAVGGGIEDRLYNFVYVYDVATDASGAIYIAGAFTHAGGIPVSNIAKWDGTAWSALGAGMNGTVTSIAFDGSGTLYAAGPFTTAGGAAAPGLARWDGAAWSAISGFTGNGNNGRVAVGGDGSLYVAGNTSGVQRLQGSTWTQLGVAGDTFNGAVEDIAVIGSDVYVAGYFTDVGGLTVNRIARWNGTSWQALGTGMDDAVLTILSDGSGVIVGGRFTSAGGVSASRLARWNGSAWTSFGGGASNDVTGLSQISGDVYATGAFSTIGSTTASGVASWDGAAWTAFGTGLSGGGNTFAPAVSGPGGLLYVAGSFWTPVKGLAVWSTSSGGGSDASTTTPPVAAQQAFAVPAGTTSAQCPSLAPTTVDWQALAGLRDRGWSISYAAWPNGGMGGFVCQRQPYWAGSTWDVQ